MIFLPLEAAAHAPVEATVPAWVFGIVALVVLLGSLSIVRGIGMSRPHS